MSKKINVGLIGLGTVGTGVARVLLGNADVIKAKLGVELALKMAADKDLKRDRGIDFANGVLSDDANAVLNDPEVSVIVELVGGTTIAKDFIIKAIENGKHVVTANKALLSAHGKEIFELAAKKGVCIGFEASVGGGIPVIKGLREGLAANRIESIYGIINGTANFILTKMTNEGGAFADVLKEAQKLGYAEADPTYDVEGIDTAHKLAILINIAYGTYVTHNDIYTEGISRITDMDIEYAKELGYRIKLLAIAKSDGTTIEARVHPTMIPEKHLLSAVDGVLNAVHINGDAVGPVLFYGRGAGMMATASAVVADIMDMARSITSGVKCALPLGYTAEAIKSYPIKKMADIEMSYYLRFSAKDIPGVLSKIAGVLGSHNISILSVIQKGRDEHGGAVPLVIITHSAFEREITASIAQIEKMDIITDKTMVIRIEES
ncbi:MAG: homoserine dehydrogenase [Deltaproteobacteria bacterium]|nr:homoserine dehydrogenase [Deltaproteobacteria bacterium]